MRAAIVVILGLVVVALTTGASGEQPGREIRSSLAGESVRLSLPAGDAQPKGLAIWFHGQGGNVNDRIDGPFLSALRRDGWAIASSNFHAQSWGNEASTEDATLLVDWAEEQTGVPVTLWVSGSMGGSISLNALNHGVQEPACWYGVKPAIALTQMGTVPKANFFIEQAFGGEPPADRDPVENVDALPDDVRYRVVASREDQLVPFALNAGPLVDGLVDRGLDVQLRTVTGDHEDPSHWNGEDLVYFANTCLDGADTSTAASN